MSEKLTIQHLTKSFGERTVLDGLSFSVRDGEFLSILGPSGCGKTTLLRILIGIESADGGDILKDGVSIRTAPPSRRGMGIVFQNYALFPNMTVLQNVTYALRFQPALKAKAKDIALDILEKVGLTEFLNKKPAQLSGGTSLPSSSACTYTSRTPKRFAISRSAYRCVLWLCTPPSDKSPQTCSFL